jgi:hypothetical protein
VNDAELFNLSARWAKQCGITDQAIAWRKASARRWRRMGWGGVLSVALVFAPLVVIAATDGWLLTILALATAHWQTFSAADCWGKAEAHENDIRALEATP